ncbi:low molecular weight protein-tyrosine-phosphatase [Corynebacterium mendelii]|uniref:low molecular weight protein-tyrosine-phosphatase n=1 Tax=Corynebacterium mendelii TaxID=2765362 RepID=UPI002ED675C5
MTSAKSIHVVFVCTGNICRSPMAEIIYRDKLEEAGLSDEVMVTSCGIGGWHVGQGADRRAVAELAGAGYDGSKHRAAQFGDRDRSAELVVALDDGHVRQLKKLGVPAERIRLLRSFDPTAPAGASVDDPYYGGREGFTRVLNQLEAAMPGLIEWAKTWTADVSQR